MKYAKQKQIESHETHRIHKKKQYTTSSICIYLTSFMDRNLFGGLNVQTDEQLLLIAMCFIKCLCIVACFCRI
jgi:hypothetical protein